MTLSLRGRMETRLFLILTIGLAWTGSLTTLLRSSGWAPAISYRSNLEMLALMGGLGLAWELGYHVLQQLRWDRDWPSAFAALAVLNEGALLWLLTGSWPWLHVRRGSAASFVLLIGTTWLAMWLFMQGPMRVVFLRWRLDGGRIRCPR
jgi:hypothetical protein